MQSTMGLFSIVALCLCTVHISAKESAKSDPDASCKREWQKAELCYAKELDKMVANEDKWKEHTENIGNCFSDSKCESPSFKRNPVSDMPESMRKVGKEIKDAWTNTSAKVKQCIKRDVGGKIGDLLSKCLSEKGVDSFNFTEMLGSDGGDQNPLEMVIGDSRGGGEDEKAKGTQSVKKLLSAAMNLVRSIRICNETKAGDAGMADKCAKTECKKVKEEFCKDAAKCDSKRKSRSTSTDCQKRGKSVFKGICQCKQEHMRTLVANLDNLRSKGGNITWIDMLQALSHGQDIREYLQAMKNCYRTNKERVPAVITFAVAMSDRAAKQQKQTAAASDGANTDGNVEGDAGGQSTGTKVDNFPIPKGVADTIRDFLATQCYDEEECDMCDDEE